MCLVHVRDNVEYPTCVWFRLETLLSAAEYLNTEQLFTDLKEQFPGVDEDVVHSATNLIIKYAQNKLRLSTSDEIKFFWVETV